jgi:protoporphyrin/coproporphyrin ferrochelatase
MSVGGIRRLAVVLFNLGGPDGPEAVEPFLFNLFNDPAIIGLPGLIRRPLARRIARGRREEATANYAAIGGGSPLLPETERQAQALGAALAERLASVEAKVFVAMRHWRPFAAETAQAVTAFAPDALVLLPLYPQYSTTTTASSLKAWRAAYRGPGRSRSVCCYPTLAGLVAAHAEAIEAAWSAAGRPPDLKLLFSAHGLPERVIRSGDPYRAQVEATVAAVRARLSPGWETEICYQSRVGPLRWIGPSTEAAIRLAGAQGKGVLVSPIAFVSEHVETLVELDRDYARVAAEVGCPTYLRVPALGVAAAFIEGLAEAVADALGREGVGPCGGWRCPETFRRCALREVA